MTIHSLARGVSYLARDILPALRRFVAPPDDDPGAYAEHLAGLHADALAEREAGEEVGEPRDECGLEPLESDCGLIGRTPPGEDSYIVYNPRLACPNCAADLILDVAFFPESFSASAAPGTASPVNAADGPPAQTPGPPQ